MRITTAKRFYRLTLGIIMVMSTPVSNAMDKIPPSHIHPDMCRPKPYVAASPDLLETAAALTIRSEPIFSHLHNANSFEIPHPPPPSKSVPLIIFRMPTPTEAAAPMVAQVQAEGAQKMASLSDLPVLIEQYTRKAVQKFTKASSLFIKRNKIEQAKECYTNACIMLSKLRTGKDFSDPKDQEAFLRLDAIRQQLQAKP